MFVIISVYQMTAGEEMTQVSFHDPIQIPDQLLKFAVIAARYQGKWVFCRHKQRSTWEIPGGHREPGEKISETARRELQEETGAVTADIRPLAVYGVSRDSATSYGMLYYAEITILEPLNETVEIGEILLADSLPCELTYPAIQPHLFCYVEEHT